MFSTFSNLLGMYGFGLEETNRYEEGATYAKKVKLFNVNYYF